jgi:hypothetical protein
MWWGPLLAFYLKRKSDGPLISSMDHFDLVKNTSRRKIKCKSDHGTWVPKRPILRPTYPLSWSKRFCSGTSKRDSHPVNVEGLWHRNAVFMNFLMVIFKKKFSQPCPWFWRKKARREKVKHKEDSQNCPFWDICKKIYKKIKHIQFFGAWSLLLVHVQFTC